jgi:hypothetical protein
VEFFYRSPADFPQRNRKRGSNIVNINFQAQTSKSNAGTNIFGAREREGVLVIPSEVAAEAIEAALAKASTKNRVATAIRGGMGAREAFETFGVL